MYSSKLLLVSVAALLALFAHSPTACVRNGPKSRGQSTWGRNAVAPALCHVGEPNQAQQDNVAQGLTEPDGIVRPGQHPLLESVTHRGSHSPSTTVNTPSLARALDIRRLRQSKSTRWSKPKLESLNAISGKKSLWLTTQFARTRRGVRLVRWNQAGQPGQADQASSRFSDPFQPPESLTD
ncbi:hypothetical protein C8R44DRAFT_749755 [Mycena epipterygia]|nr:hypothetical protein C8R44DRAFT_749755 [Mycena epipterygia]